MTGNGKTNRLAGSDGLIADGGLTLLDDGILLLRRMPAAAWLLYWGTSAPFVLGLVFFWADMSRNAFARERCPGQALALAGLFILMKTGQTYFCAWLENQRRGRAAPEFSPGAAMRVACSQAYWQSLGLVVTPLALLAVMPFAWSVAFFQNLLVLAWPASDRRGSSASLAARQSFLWPKQNHVGLCLIALLGGVIFISCMVLLLTLPYLVRALLGVDTVFTLGGAQVLNTTLLACALALSYLAVDPLVKAFYVLRCFHGLARKTGVDLLTDLARQRSPSVVGIMLLALLVSTSVFAVRAEGGPAAERLDRAIEEVARHPRYSWRLPRERDQDQAFEDYGLIAFVQQWSEALRRSVEKVADTIDRFFAWLEGRGEGRWATPGRQRWGGRGRVYAWLLSVSFVALASFFMVRRGLRRRRRRRRDNEAPVPLLPLDLTSEEIAPDDLSTDEWFALATKMHSTGEWRLALRALFLGALAGLAKRKLVLLQRGKSGREYVSELHRRGAAFVAESEDFSAMTAAYECVWYGRRLADAPMVRGFDVCARRLATGEREVDEA